MRQSTSLDMKMVGHRIRIVRENRKYSQQKLAALTNLSSNYIRRIELGNCNPSLSVMCALSDALNVSVDYLVNGKESYKVGEEQFYSIPADTYDRIKKLISKLDTIV